MTEMYAVMFANQEMLAAEYVGFLRYAAPVLSLLLLLCVFLVEG